MYASIFSNTVLAAELCLGLGLESLSESWPSSSRKEGVVPGVALLDYQPVLLGYYFATDFQAILLD